MRLDRLDRIERAEPVAPLPPPTFDFVVFDAVMIGAFVGLSLAIAQALQLDRPYWVPVSCLAVIQGVSLRAVWNRQLQRVLGTAAGMLLAWGLLSLPLDPWRIALLVILLAFTIETLVVRHYGLAVIFITPLTLLLAEAATLGHAPLAELIESRFTDTLLGCVVGLVGGVCLHSARFREFCSLTGFALPLIACIGVRTSRGAGGGGGGAMAGALTERSCCARYGAGAGIGSEDLARCWSAVTPPRSIPGIRRPAISTGTSGRVT